MRAKTPGDATPEAESTFSPHEIIARAQTALGVTPEAAAGALSGCTEPLTIAEARERVQAWINREVK